MIRIKQETPIPGTNYVLEKGDRIVVKGFSKKESSKLEWLYDLSWREIREEDPLYYDMSELLDGTPPLVAENKDILIMITGKGLLVYQDGVSAIMPENIRTYRQGTILIQEILGDTSEKAWFDIYQLVDETEFFFPLAF